MRCTRTAHSRPKSTLQTGENMTLPTFRPATFARGQVAILCEPGSTVERLAVQLGARYSKRQKAYVMSREDGEVLLKRLERQSTA